jgi:hypothetical protein
MLSEGMLTFREFAMKEPLPLATIQGAVLEFLRGRDDAVLFGAQAVNAYVDQPRMTQDVDILSTRAVELAEELRQYLNTQFQIAVRVREFREGLGYRIYQVQEPKNRHLVDLRPVKTLPPTNRLSDILVVTPAELIAGKVNAYQSRRGKPKSGTDWRDLALLLLAFPELKAHDSEVRVRLEANKADPKVLAVWKELVDQEIVAEEDEDDL